MSLIQVKTEPVKMWQNFFLLIDDHEDADSRSYAVCLSCCFSSLGICFVCGACLTPTGGWCNPQGACWFPVRQSSEGVKRERGESVFC